MAEFTDLAPKVTTIDSVNADLRWMYKPDGDGFLLDAENPNVKSTLSTYNNLLHTLKRSRADTDAARKAKVDLTPLSEYGQTPEEIANSFKAKAEELTQQIKGVNVEKIREGVTKEWQPKYETEQRKVKSLAEQLHTVMVTNEAISAIAKEKGDARLLLPFIKEQVKVTEVDGKFIVNVIDATGETRYTGAQPTSIAELVKEMKADKQYGKLFESEAPSGAGTRPGAPSRPVSQPGTKVSSVDKITMGLNKGQASSR